MLPSSHLAISPVLDAHFFVDMKPINKSNHTWHIHHIQASNPYMICTLQAKTRCSFSILWWPHPFLHHRPPFLWYQLLGNKKRARDKIINNLATTYTIHTRFILENPYGKNHPTIDLLFPLTKPDQSDQPTHPNQVTLHCSTLDTLQ